MSTTTNRAPSGEQLVTWVRDASRRLLELIADLDDAALDVPLAPTVNPLLWEIGHVTWFSEIFVLRRALGRPPIIEHADALWDSAAVPHDTRWFLALPSREQTLDYVAEVTEREVAALARPESSAQLAYITRYAVHHHDMHTEALTYTRQALALPAPILTGLDTPDTAPSTGPLPADAAIPGGRFALGADRDEPFVHDNEKWVHPVVLEPFAISRAPVTQGEFAAFVADGGYARCELWGDEGWAWRSATAAKEPLYWRRGADGWQRRDFDTWVALEANRPVCHVNFFEAEAYCRWTGRRLPTEAEWEAAALGQPDGSGGLAAAKQPFPWGGEPVSAERAHLDWAGMGTADVAAYPAGDSAFGVRQLLGNVWEWTSSTFQPYPNFEQDAYRENSWPFFGSRKVLRGGAWATRSRLARPTVRNYFTPDRRDVFAGFRTVAAS